jgi:hypothetical protein
MRKWYIITIIVVIGVAFAVFALLLVSKAPAPDATDEAPRRGFVSFFGRQFGFDNGGTDGSAPASTSTPAEWPTFRQRLALEKMISLSREMVSGATFTASTTASTTIESARFVERETGHIYDMSLETGSVRRISNTTVPRIQEALFGVNGSAVALRYLADNNETVETYVAPLPTDPNASSTELNGVFFRQNISALAFSPDTSEVFYLTSGDAGAAGRIATISGTDVRTVFSLPLSEWLAHWEAPGFIDLSTKPSYLAFGAAERVGKSGGITRTFSGTRGLTILPSPGGTRMLFSTSDGTATRIFIHDLSTRENTEFLIPTLPEKCVWADEVHAICAIPSRVSGGMPDVWYQGGVSFTDSFWMLDGEVGTVDFLFDPADTPARETVDATMLMLSYDNSVLSFINKKDLRGWVADLSEWF